MSSEFFFVPKTLPERNHHKTWSPEAMENNKTGWTMLNRDCSENLKCVVFFNINFPFFFPKPRFFLCKELRENPQKFKKIWRCHPNKSENPPSLRFKVQKSAPYINHRLQVWGSSFHPGYNRINQREPTWGSHFFFGCSLASCFELLELMVVQTISFWCRSSDRGDFVWPKSLVKSWGRTLIFCTSMYTYCIWVTYRAFGGMLREQTATAKVLSQQDRHFPCDFCWTKRLSKCFVWDVRRKVFSSDSVATDCLNTAGVGMCMARSVRQIIDSQMAMAGNFYCS